MRRFLIVLPIGLLAAAATPIQPGRWQTSVQITDVKSSIPGMAAMMGRPTTVSACVTPAQAAAGPRAAIENTNGRCRYSSYAVANGRINSVMACSRPGGTMTVRSSGSYTPTMIEVNGIAAMTGGMAMTMRTHTISRRVGGC